VSFQREGGRCRREGLKREREAPSAHLGGGKFTHALLREKKYQREGVTLFIKEPKTLIVQGGGGKVTLKIPLIRSGKDVRGGREELGAEFSHREKGKESS